MILFFGLTIIGQKNFNITFKTGVVFPRYKYYMGKPIESNNKGDFELKTGYTGQVQSKIKFNKKNSLGLSFSYLFFKLAVKEYIRFPNDINYNEISYYKSDFSQNSIGIGLLFEHNIFKFFKLTSCVQYDIPINNHTGYLYNPPNLISQQTTYRTNGLFNIQGGMEYIFFRNKSIEISISPCFTLFLMKDSPSLFFENTIRKYYFSLLTGINLK